LHIIETTIPTKFCTVTKTAKCPSWVVSDGLNTRITNQKWRTAVILEKSKCRHIWVTFWQIATIFGTVMQF